MECKQCNISFNRRRKNQIFCSKKCRSDFNNDKAYQIRKITNRYNKSLIHNRHVLVKIYRDFGKKLISKDFLEGAGYNFSMLTHSLEDNNKKVCNFCFDYAIRKLESNLFQVIRYEHNI